MLSCWKSFGHFLGKSQVKYFEIWEEKCGNDWFLWGKQLSNLRLTALEAQRILRRRPIALAAGVRLSDILAL